MSLLAALDAISIRQPAYFESDFLPFRRALESESTLMERIKSFEWQEVITSLYFPLEANFRADLINRDSPLTEELLKLLRQSVDPDLPKSDLSAELLKFLKLTAQVSTNSGEIRDAALSLSVLGDESWIKSFLANSGHQKYLLRPFIVCIAKALAIVFNRNRTRTLFSTFDRDLANVRTYNRELHRAFTRASNYTTDIMRILDLVQLRATACINIRSIDNANESVEVLTTFSSNAHTCTRDLIEAQKLGYKIVEAIQSVKSRWRLDIQLMKRLESLLNSILNIYTFITTYAFVAKSWESLLAACKEPLVTEARSSNEPSEMTLSDLMLNLGSSNDTLRESAQKILMTPRRASFVGKVLIEQMAEIACSSVGMISSQMECSLQMIIHDTSSWIDQWIKQIEEADERCIAEVIVGSIHRITPKAFPAILNALHDPSPRTSMPLLKSLSWLARSEQIPKELEKSTREKLLAWLDREGDPNTQGSIISVLGYWHAHPDIISDALLIRLRWPIMSSVFPALYTALARLCMERPDYDKAVWRTIVSACPHPAAAAALVRLSLKKVKSRSSTEKSTPVENRQLDAPKNPGTKLLDEVTKALPDVSNCLIALLEAGTDDDNWDDEYHGIIVKAIRELLEHSASLLPTLLIRLQLAISERNWPSRRIILAAVAACSEVMPIAVQRACPGNLEILLVKAATDAESYTSRRFAIRALSYLRTVTPAIIPALLAGCQDIKAVQNDTIAAASGFQTIEGVPFPLGRLTDALTGESTSTAYAVIQLLGALGASAAGEASDLREQIIEALVGALKNPISKKKLLIPGQNEIKLEDALYTALLQVTGWIG